MKAIILTLTMVTLLTSIPGEAGWQVLLSDIPDQRIHLSIFNTLPLDQEKRAALEKAVKSRDYANAEQILVDSVNHQPSSSVLLAFLGRIFFLDKKYLNCAIALNKAEKVSPLEESERFLLAMSYVALDHQDWARTELEKLTRSNPGNPLYTYWLGRIDYDAMRYEAAADRFKTVLKLDPNYMKAYDNLGLTYEGLGQYDEAIKTYTKALELNRKHTVPSPWPPLNLGTLLVKVGKPEDAENSLRESLRYDSHFAKAHYQLGFLLENQKRDEQAIVELRQAIQFDPAYPEPHYSLGRIYQRRGDKQKAEDEFRAFKKLKIATPQENRQ